MEAGLPFEAVDIPGMRDADAIISITSSFDATLLADHVSPGTHIACMGTDTKGKQELEADLLAKATVFTDEVAQSISIAPWRKARRQAFRSRSGLNFRKTRPGFLSGADTPYPRSRAFSGS